jgi:hypothetical protein
MVRGTGSARAETSVKVAARANMIRIRMRHGPLRDTLDDDLSTITISPFITSIALPLNAPRDARDRFLATRQLRPGPVWFQINEPKAQDFVRLQELSSRHAISGHGPPVRDKAKEAYTARFQRAHEPG